MQLAKAVIAGLVWVLVMAGLLLGTAELVGGDWRWARAWVFLAVYGAISVGGTVALALLRPASFAVRMQGLVAEKAKKQPLLDAIGTPVFILYLAAWMAFIPWDLFRLRLLPEPSWLLAAIGLVMVATGPLIGFLAVAQNQFAAPTVQEQAGQKVIDTGVYAVIRHPLYAANLLTFSGMALWLGSTAALAGVVVILLFTMARIAVEEAHLKANLPGYADYAARVRSRLIPHVL
jgi:protein-S-isoprenylcysteine O-methyltransferase Ste14